MILGRGCGGSRGGGERGASGLSCCGGGKAFWLFAISGDSVQNCVPQEINNGH